MSVIGKKILTYSFAAQKETLSAQTADAVSQTMARGGDEDAGRKISQNIVASGHYLTYMNSSLRSATEAER